MYPGRFEYQAPTSLDEALAALDRYGDEAKVLAGGQSLIPLMKLRFASPVALVDINRVPGLDGLAEEERRAAHRRARAPQGLRALRPARRPLRGARRCRAADLRPDRAQPRARVAGSLAHADPQGDWGSALMAAGARVVARGSARGPRDRRSTTSSRGRSRRRSSPPR